jgi:hypothetical protein
VNVQRRGFLGLLAAAPIAGPVIAREAAASAGAMPVGSSFAIDAMRSDCTPCSPSSNKEWAEQTIKRVFDRKWIDERREWYLKRRVVGVLDPDLASSRSFSLSTAIRIQRQRDFERYLAVEQEEAKSTFLSAFGFEWRHER